MTTSQLFCIHLTSIFSVDDILVESGFSIDDFRKSGNFCVCPTPCTEDLYVASVSFSSMNVDSDVISGAEKVKMDKLQRRLETAREITFR